MNSTPGSTLGPIYTAEPYVKKFDWSTVYIVYWYEQCSGQIDERPLGEVCNNKKEGWRILTFRRSPWKIKHMLLDIEVLAKESFLNKVVNTCSNVMVPFLTLAALSLLLFATNSGRTQNRTNAQKVVSGRGSKRDKVVNTCASKSPHDFIRIWFVWWRSGRCWNGSIVEIVVFTYWIKSNAFSTL